MEVEFWGLRLENMFSFKTQMGTYLCLENLNFRVKSLLLKEQTRLIISWPHSTFPGEYVLISPCEPRIFSTLHRTLKVFIYFASAHAVPLAWNALPPPLGLVSSCPSSSLTQVALPLSSLSRLLQKKHWACLHLCSHSILFRLWNFTSILL